MTEDPANTSQTFHTPADAAGQRLDRVLAALADDISRSRLQALIEEGFVQVGGTVEPSPKRKLRGGETIILTLPLPRPSGVQAEDIPLDIVFEDAHLLVVNKPPGLVVHPAPGTPDGTLVNALLAHCGDSLAGIGGEKRPGIVHRIDKDTSGLMVVAKSAVTHEGLGRQFHDHSITRVYTAFVWGWPNPTAGTVTGSIGRDPHNRKRMAVVTRGGKDATTHYKTIARYGAATKPVAALVECRLETGRTHQIRVHMTAAGHALIGDPLYGRASRHAARVPRESPAGHTIAAFNRQALHAGALGFIHPVTAERLTFKAELPSDMKRLKDSLEHFQENE
ncbi:MAG: RluA family pseudouridine synthase [Sphingomonadales bacterium]